MTITRTDLIELATCAKWMQSLARAHVVLTAHADQEATLTYFDSTPLALAEHEDSYIAIQAGVFLAALQDDQGLAGAVIFCRDMLTELSIALSLADVEADPASVARAVLDGFDRAGARRQYGHAAHRGVLHAYNAAVLALNEASDCDTDAAAIILSDYLANIGAHAATALGLSLGLSEEN